MTDCKKYKHQTADHIEARVAQFAWVVEKVGFIAGHMRYTHIINVIVYLFCTNNFKIIYFFDFN